MQRIENGKTLFYIMSQHQSVRWRITIKVKTLVLKSNHFTTNLWCTNRSIYILTLYVPSHCSICVRFRTSVKWKMLHNIEQQKKVAKPEQSRWWNLQTPSRKHSNRQFSNMFNCCRINRNETDISNRKQIVYI